MTDFLNFFTLLLRSEKDKLVSFDITKLLVIVAILIVAFIICVKITQKYKLYEENNKKKEILHTQG